MIRIISVLAAVIAGWIFATLLFTAMDPWLAGRGIEPLTNRVFLDKAALGVHLTMAEGAALGVALLAGIGVALRKPKGVRRRKR